MKITRWQAKMGEDTVHTGMRFPSHLYKRLKELAHSRNKSIELIVNEAVEAYIGVHDEYQAAAEIFCRISEQDTSEE